MDGNTATYYDAAANTIIPHIGIDRGAGVAIPIVATPTFSLTEGTYTGSQIVTISTATTGATICYTTNGVDSTSSSTLINGTSGSVTISSTTTLKARAFKSGSTDSGVASAIYTISTSGNGEIDRTNEGGTGNGVQDSIKKWRLFRAWDRLGGRR